VSIVIKYAVAMLLPPWQPLHHIPASAGREILSQLGKSVPCRNKSLGIAMHAFASMHWRYASPTNHQSIFVSTEFDNKAQENGNVSCSSLANQTSASCRLSPHISSNGCSPAQNDGRSGFPKMRQRLSSPSWMHRIPAGFPSGIPGIGLVMEGAIQQAPH
jgi:hypothetical protein